MEGSALARFSHTGRLVAGISYPSEGYSVIEKWRDGRRCCLVEHDESRGAQNLVIETPNCTWASIIHGARCLSGYWRLFDNALPSFEVPVKLGELLTGFHPDQLLSAQLKSEALTAVTPPTPGGDTTRTISG